jgi:hypothetical protein
MAATMKTGELRDRQPAVIKRCKSCEQNKPLTLEFWKPGGVRGNGTPKWRNPCRACIDSALEEKRKYKICKGCKEKKLKNNENFLFEVDSKGYRYPSGECLECRGKRKRRYHPSRYQKCRKCGVWYAKRGQNYRVISKERQWPRRNYKFSSICVHCEKALDEKHSHEGKCVGKSDSLENYGKCIHVGCRYHLIDFNRKVLNDSQSPDDIADFLVNMPYTCMWEFLEKKEGGDDGQGYEDAVYSFTEIADVVGVTKMAIELIYQQAADKVIKEKQHLRELIGQWEHREEDTVALAAEYSF